MLEIIGELVGWLVGWVGVGVDGLGDCVCGGILDHIWNGTGRGRRDVRQLAILQVYIAHV